MYCCYVLRTWYAHLVSALDPPLTFVLGDSDADSIDLSKATKLKDAVFFLTSPNVEWITVALQTITPEHRHLRQISIRVLYNLALTEVGADIRQVIPTIGEPFLDQWLCLDRLRPILGVALDSSKDHVRYAERWGRNPQVHGALVAGNNGERNCRFESRSIR